MKAPGARANTRFSKAIVPLIAALGLLITATPPASASAPIILSGSSWLGGNGVNVCSNSNGGGNDPNCGTQPHVGGMSGAWWQCVELAQRLYQARGWHSGIFANVGGAYQIYDQASALGMSRQANGSITSLAPGDMIIHGTDTGGGFGHVAIVDSVVGNTAHAVEQNASPSGRTMYSFSGGTLSRSGTGTIRGVVHDNDNQGTPGNGASSNRIGVLSGGMLDVKEGPVGAMWTTVGGGSQFELSSNRIAIYTGGHLDVKEGGLGATWITVTGSVDEFHITDNRIGIRVGNQIFVKEGSIGATWVLVADGVSSFALSPNRIAVYNGTTLSVKEGPLNAGWTAVTGQVDDYQLTDNRIGIRVGGQISVKEGSVGAMWTLVGGGSAFKMSSNRIAVYDGQLSVKEGSVGAMWVTVTGAVDAFDITNNRVGIMVGGQLSIKDGPLNATWTLVGGGSAFDLS